MFPSVSPQGHSLGAQMLREEVKLDIEEIRQCIHSVIHNAMGASPYHGGICLDNIVYLERKNFMLGQPEALLALWRKWLEEGNSSMAYVPPEGLGALPASAGCTDKTDSWAVGCLLAHLLNHAKPLTLKRRMSQAPYSEVFKLGQIEDKPNLLTHLQNLYVGAGQEAGLIVGPECNVMDTIPYACEEFLAHSLEPQPEKRWSLQQLSQLPFVDVNISLEELANKEKEYYETLPVKDVFTVQVNGPHPFLASSTTLSVKLGEMTRPHHDNTTIVEVWRFSLFNEKDERALYAKAYGKLVDLTRMEASADDHVRRRAQVYAIRALQKGAINVVHHYGCQFFAAPNTTSVPEFHVFTEHCMGGSFQEASSHYIPTAVLTKWTGSVLCGLQFLHSHGIVHRNVNSAIIFFTEHQFQGTIKIGGFHNMRQLNADKTQKHEVSARRGDDGRFVAPEISDSYKNDVNVGRKCDMWSVGCVVLHLVTGQPPLYTGPNGKPVDTEMAVVYHLNHQKKGPEIPDWVPATMRVFVDKCLQFSPEKRPSAADLLQEWLNATADDETTFADYRRKGGAEDLPQGVVSYWKQKDITEA